jgi:hypothetical protein
VLLLFTLAHAEIFVRMVNVDPLVVGAYRMAIGWCFSGACRIGG